MAWKDFSEELTLELKPQWQKAASLTKRPPIRVNSHMQRRQRVLQAQEGGHCAWAMCRAEDREEGSRQPPAKDKASASTVTEETKDISGAAGHSLCRKCPFSSNCLLVSEPGDMAVNSAQIQDSRTIPWFIYRQLRLVAWGFYSFLTMVNVETFASIKITAKQ